ncbi:binding-protein-dependent transport systems inner membrane component [Rhodobacteraceae bacterium KLH11]|nr:binding-protein-dependent transport systems inner membrane component [Rhodobacteraceae bacterium KLH11]
MFPGFGVWTVLFFVYLYVPILILVFFSFNGGKSATVWSEFSLRWYQTAFNNADIQRAAYNSLVIAFVSTGIAVVVAVLAALVTSRGGEFRGKSLAYGTIMLPLVVPEIVTAVATLSFFAALGISWGAGNLIIAHTVFCIPFAYLPIRARLEGMDSSLEQAALDLYANEWRTFWFVTFPLIMPGIISGATLSFIVSIDNFIISLMVAEPGVTTLPIYIYSLVRLGVTPEVNAVSTVMLMISIVFVAISYIAGKR